MSAFVLICVALVVVAALRVRGGRRKSPQATQAGAPVPVPATAPVRCGLRYRFPGSQGRM
jgi:hypothetical protein